MQTKSAKSNPQPRNGGALEILTVASGGTRDPMVLLRGYVPADLAAAFITAARAAGVSLTVR